jgi:methionine-rich copper-binding protein CopC
MMMAVLPLMLSAGPAFAHAFLEHARPPVGSELASPPPAVSITFTEDVEPQFSRIEVRTTTGTRVDKGDLHADGDRARLAVSLPHLAPGTYTVSWHVTSIDTHKTEGQFTFTVKP